MVWVAVGIGVVGAVTSIAGGISGKKAAEKAGKATAETIMATSKENMRRRTLGLEEQVGTITAAVGASNLQMSGSAKRYRTAFESNIRSEMAWDKQKARMDANTARKGGQLAGQAAMYSGIGNAIGFAGQAYAAAPKYLGKNPGKG